MMVHCWWAHGLNFRVITLDVQCLLGYTSISTGAARMQPIVATDARLLGLPGADRGTAESWQPWLRVKWEETSIPAQEEVPKWLMMPLPDATSGD